MSMITGCPACGTLFKVVPDQLRLSDGWVRCGHCGEVFDAAAAMQPSADEATAAADGGPANQATTAHPPADDPMPATWPAPLPAAEVASAGPSPDPSPASPPAPPALPPTTAAPDAKDVPAASATSAPVAAEPDFGVSSAPALLRPDVPGDDTSADDSLYPPIERVRAESEARVSRWREDDDDDDQDDADAGAGGGTLAQVSFVREARRQAWWRRPIVRGVLALGVLVLAALLALQWAVQERDRLAAQDPRWRGLLQRACVPLGCAVGPLRRIEALAIDSSGFTRLRQDAYTLSVTLRNQAPEPVALPALELTLTDARDQPLLRRVLLPRELGADGATVAGKGDWSTSIAIAVDPATAGSQVAGYRLLAFYP